MLRGEDCTVCTDLTKAALEASQAYHHCLEALESAHISKKVKTIFPLRVGLEDATLTRTNAITALHQHQRTHTSGSP